MGNFFRSKRSSPPPVQMTPFSPAVAAPSNPPVNFMQLFDAVSGKNFTFVNGTNGERYLQLRDQLADAERGTQRVIQGVPGIRVNGVRRPRTETVRDEEQIRSLREQMQQEGGRLSVSVNRDPNRLSLDATINAVNTNLPEVNYNMRYAVAVANLTGRLRDLSNTIDTMERTSPFLIEQNQGLINSFKEATQQALNKGFDIRQNGLDTKLINMGLMNSSNALGAQIALARERTEAMVNAELQTHQLAQGAKQNSIENMFRLGDQLVQSGGLELNQYVAETGNEIAGAQMEQDRANNQARLNLDRAQAATNAQLADMQHSLAYSQVAQNFINPAADRALTAMGQDNSAFLQRQRNELGQSALNTQRWAVGQANRSDPWRTLGMGLVSNVAGAATAPLINRVGNFSSNLFGGGAGRTFSQSEERDLINRRWG